LTKFNTSVYALLAVYQIIIEEMDKISQLHPRGIVDTTISKKYCNDES